MMSSLPTSSVRWGLSRPVRLQKLALKPDEVWAIAGKRGTGKSYFGRYLLRGWYGAGTPERFWPILIIDQDQKWLKHARGKVGFAEKPELSTVEQPWNITATGRLEPRARVMIFEPEIPAWQDERFLVLMQEVFHYENIILYFDELFGVVENQHAPVIVRKLWTSGRKKNIAIIACFQRPVDIPKVVLNQADNFAVFHLADPADREKLAGIMGEPQVNREIDYYWHWEKLASERRARLVGPLPESEVR
jgi:hypothetical protein